MERQRPQVYPVYTISCLDDTCSGYRIVERLMKKDLSGVAAAGVLATIVFGLLAYSDYRGRPKPASADGTHTVTVEVNPAADQAPTDAARAAADQEAAIQRLGEIPAPPPTPVDRVWYVVVASEDRCETLQEGIGASYPAEAMDIFASEGNPLDILHFDGTSLLARQVHNPDGPRLLLVMGEARCRLFLAGVTPH